MNLTSTLRFISFVGLLAVVASACSQKTKPFAHGATMNQKAIERTFTPILTFMEIKPGHTFADVGAASGDFPVMMATLLDSITIYIQDIDTAVLKQQNLNKIIDYYSAQCGHNLRFKHEFVMVIGDTLQTNLPDNTFDRIYSNATFHVFDDPEAMLTDLHKKLKPSGMIFIRDSFSGDHEEGAFCSDAACAKPLYSIPQFLSLMKRNGFTLVKENPDMSGYPVYGFALATE
jgi:ubiquinone/menaquinone biosynthesis C-methylase UbiE